MKTFYNIVTHIVKSVLYFLLGVVFLALVSLLLCLCAPLFLYRSIITGLVAPVFFKRYLGRVVDTLGTFPAMQFLDAKIIPPTNSILVNVILERPIFYDDLYQTINEKWILAKGQNGKLKYPELTQYLDSWMGFMFWKPEPQFSLKSHLKCHALKPEDPKELLNYLNEKFLNAPYTEKQSPWDICLVENYQFCESHGTTSCTTASLVIFRIHHAMADGFALLHLIAEQLCGESFEIVRSPRSGQGNPRTLLNKTLYPFKLPQAFGLLVCQILGSPRETIFHVPKTSQSSHQVCKKARPIPVSKMKQLKNKFGVSFAAILYFALGGAFEKLGNTLGNTNLVPNILPMSTALPVQNRTKKLTNDMLGAILNVPISPALTTEERLKSCERMIQKKKRSETLLVAYYIGKCIASLPVPLLKPLSKSQTVSTFVSTIVGPETPLVFNNATLLAADFSVGLAGNAGMTVSTFSYKNQLRIVATAKTVVIPEKELEQFVNFIVDEIYSLDELSTGEDMESVICY